MTDRQFTLDRSYDQSELAALFGEFAAALEDDRPATVDLDDGAAEIAVPPRVSVRLAGVREETPPTEGLEIVLEWDGSAEDRRIQFEPSPDAEPVDDVAETEAGPTDDVTESQADALSDRDAGAKSAPAEPASSVMPTEAFSSKTEQPRQGTGPDSDAESGADEASGGRTSRFEVYRDRAGEWRWRLVHWNGNIVADSGEGYASRFNAVRAARGVMRATADARIEHLGE